MHANRFLPRWIRVAPDSLLATSQRRGQPEWIEFIHVLWTIWVFVVPVFTPQGYDARWWALTALSYPLFLALYIGTLVLSPRWIIACGTGMLVLCLALLPWYPSGMSYFVFGCVMLGAHRWRSGWHYAAALLLANVSLVALARSIGYPWSALVWLPVTTLVVGLVVHVERQRQRKDSALRLSQEEVRRLAATAERERIGRDLHDLLGHTLSLITLKLELSRKLIDRDPGAARLEISEAEKVARHALAEVRSAVTGIRAADIAAELAAARLLLESSGVALDYAAPPDMPAELERPLALVLREASTNIARHAGASHAAVSFESADGAVRMRITDNGRGGVGAHGNGLDGMCERIRALGGRLDIASPAGAGTCVQVEVPLAKAPVAAGGQVA
jgi:two-component system sensor histidine kinase DesK